MTIKQNYSVKRLPFLWLVRVSVVMFVVLAGGLLTNKDLLFTETSNAAGWAGVFANVNHLLEKPELRSIKSEESLIRLVAQKKQYVPDLIRSTHADKQLHKSSLRAIRLSGKDISLIPIDELEVDIRAYVDYNAQLATMYAMRQQHNSNKASSKHLKYETGGGIGPTIIDNELNNSAIELYENLAGNDNFSSTILGGSSAKITDAYNAVFNVGINMGGRFTVNTGVSYAQYAGNQRMVIRNHVQQEQTYLVFKSTGPGRDGIGVPTSETVHSFSNDTLYTSLLRRSIEIPLALKYTIGEKRINYFIQSGINTVISSNISGNYSSTELEDASVNSKLNGISSINISISAGIQYQMLQNLQLNFSPNYQVPFYQSLGSLPVYNRLGILTGINYIF